MELVKRFSGRSFLGIIILMVLLVAAMDAVLFFGIKLVVIKGAAAKAMADGIQYQDALGKYLFLNQWFIKYFIPATAVIGLIFSVIFWLVMKMTLSGVVKKQGGLVEKTAVNVDKNQEKIRENTNKRMFLHLLSVLQREGRLLDFFFEKLDQYEDAQIGAAVRNIHENCHKTVEKYLSPSPVIDSNEGDTVTIDPGFDPMAIKLTGNVTGEPPFKGVLRHKGWQAEQLEVPVLSEMENPKIIAPAEVEID